MSRVLETLDEYDTFLRYERRLKPSTIRKINLSLHYFTTLYGITDTKDLKASDMYIFYERLKRRCCTRKKGGEVVGFGDAFLEKIMTNVKSYVRWLSDKAYLKELVPADVPR